MTLRRSRWRPVTELINSGSSHALCNFAPPLSRSLMEAIVFPPRANWTRMCGNCRAPSTVESRLGSTSTFAPLTM
jgi:hypothetical protein